MRLRPLVIAAATTTLSLSLSACTGIGGGLSSSDDGMPPIPAGVTPGVDWFGNPPPDSDPIDPSCEVPAVAPPRAAVAGNPELSRPINTPPGHNWITYGIVVNALSQNMYNDLCVPVHIVVTRNTSEPDSQVLGHENYEFWTHTPWMGVISFDYDPTLDRYQGRPPHYQIIVRADYQSEYDQFKNPGGIAPVAIGCVIRLNGAAIAGLPIVPGGTCETEFNDNRFKSA